MLGCAFLWSSVDICPSESLFAHFLLPICALPQSTYHWYPLTTLGYFLYPLLSLSAQ